MAVIGRERLTQYRTDVAGGHVPVDLHLYEVDEFMGIVARTDSPIMELVGTTSKETNKIDLVCGDTDLVPRVVTVSGAHTNVVTAINLVAGHGDRLQLWDQLYNPKTGEVLLIKAEPGHNALSVVERGRGPTNGVAIADQQVLQVLSPAIPEGVDTPLSPTSTGSTYTAYMQIIEYSFQLSHRARVSPNYEFMNDRFKEELDRLMTQSTIDLGLNLLFSPPNPGDGTGTNPSTMTGIKHAISTNVYDFTNTVADFRQIMDVFQAMYSDVGKDKIGKTIMGDATGKRIWNSLFSGLKRDRTGSDKAASTTWDTYDTDFGAFKYVIIPEMTPGEWIAWDPSDVQLYHMEGGKWSTGVYETRGWYEFGFLRGDYGVRWNNERRRARFINIDTNLSHYANVDKPV